MDSAYEQFLKLKIMENKIRLVYIDEDEGWQSIAYNNLHEFYDLFIPQLLPKEIMDLWSMIRNVNADAILIDYRLNESGKVHYTGDDAIVEIRKHNKHLPMFIITSFEENALIECKEAQIIRDKELLADLNQITKLKNIISANVDNYNRRKETAENIIREIQCKIIRGEDLSSNEWAAKFDAELYLSELDLDNGVRSDLITKTSNETLEELLTLAKNIINLHR